MANRIQDILLTAFTSAFGVLWLGIMVSAGAEIPVVGFAVAIPASLVIYSVRAAITGSARERVYQRLP